MATRACANQLTRRGTCQEATDIRTGNDESGVEPEAFFGRTGFTGGHENSILALLNGTYDAAATWWTNAERSNVTRMEGKHMIPRGQVHYVWKSPQLPSSPWAIHTDLPAPLRADVRAALVALPIAGVMAIAVSDTGTLAKLFAEAIENVDRRQLEGVRATGANRLQLMRFAIFPQVFPVMLSHVLYYCESNTRSATILGVVGAGGIGLHLADRIRVNNWDEVSFLLLMILVVVTGIDLLSKTIRLRYIQAGTAVALRQQQRA